MSELFRSILLGSAGLSAAAIVALLLTFARLRIAPDNMVLRSTLHVAATAIILQVGHFLEELAFGFDDRFPRLLGLAPWPTAFFVAFNVSLLILWTASVFGLRARRRMALFPLWFLGLACLANGIAHPAFAVASGGYFPGVITAPFVGAMGFLLLRRLALLTAKTESN